MTTVINRRRITGRLARAAVFGLLALAGALYSAHDARAQWTTSGTSTTTTNNVGIGTASPAYAFDLLSPTDRPFRVRDNAGREYFSTSSRTGPYAHWTTPVVSLSGGRLIVENNGPEGDNHTIIRRVVNSMFFHPSDHPDLPGGIAVMQKGGTYGLFVNQGVNGNVGVGTGSPQFLLDVSGSTGTPFRVRDNAGREYFTTTTHSGPWGVAPVASIAGGRLIVDANGPDGGNETIIRRVVNSMIFTPSDHPDLPGGFIVTQKGGTYGLFVNQGANGNVGIGTSAPTAKLHVAGNITVDGNINAKYQDVAEWVPSAQKLTAGMVVRLDPERTNQVLASNVSYDTSVAGVISAQPGIALGEAGEGKVLVATTGRVKVRVDATKGAIRVGDLLVTSDREGFAMKSEPVLVGGRKMHSPGTIVGKALEPLASGTGEILVLLSLQ